MNRTVAASLSLILLCTAVGAGCSSSRTPQARNPAAETDATFRERWLDQRTKELAAQGLSTTDAQVRATREFQERYSFTRASEVK